jgi:glycosyltransferase involved in cell wall biosynthesis
MPRFSIIITCYNQFEFISNAVDSALAQDYADKEIVVVDDGSTDGSKKILEKYGDAIKLKSLVTNEGASAARNWGAALSNGDFLVFLDGDDLLLPWALNFYGRIIDLKSPKLILCTMLFFNHTFSLVNISCPPAKIKVVDYKTYIKKDRACRLSASALVVDRQSFNNVGGWTRGLFPMEDHDFVLKLGNSGRTIQIVSPKTTAYRIHANNTIHQIKRIIDNIFTLIRREKMGHYPGGRTCRYDIYGEIGGFTFYYLKKAFKMKFYGKSLKLLAAGWPMILVAIFRRCIIILRGRQPIETLTIETPVRFR